MARALVPDRGDRDPTVACWKPFLTASPHQDGNGPQTPEGMCDQRNFTNFVKKCSTQASPAPCGPAASTHVGGLVPSVMPHVVHHAGEQAQAGRDVVREHEDAEGLRGERQRDRSGMWEAAAQEAGASPPHRGLYGACTALILRPPPPPLPGGEPP